ncbi:hypothetical protein ES288_D08G034100v1 [Gossypium darwinii]|uniref:Uncharacterized protein n=2 Tax=Gossypium TaxID=3633 RepID=A0A5D2JPK2_GOSTO|nr:hypothetical protein ES288_D08G034100v1 [Gossypium darwinii]TYH56630.1 hypothetical protein ES332_D08G033700v1 [Gossypium tomentosum]
MKCVCRIPHLLWLIQLVNFVSRKHEILRLVLIALRILNRCRVLYFLCGSTCLLLSHDP